MVQESVHITKAETVAAWVRPETGPSGTGRIVISSYDWDATISERKGWTLGDEYGSTDHFQFIVWGDAGTQAVATYSGFFAEYDDEWVHVAGVFKPGQAVELYINGVLEASDTTNVPSELDPSELLEIGSRADSSTQAHWDGDIDEVRVLGDALTGTELQTLSTVGAGSKTERLTISLAGKAYAIRTIEKNSSGTTVSSSIRHLLTDHLGSTQATVYHSSGGVVSGSLARYKPFGEYRTTPTADDSDRGFTGHMENRYIGLTYMNARFYVSSIGRFASADTIVPDPNNPQAYNRFSYVYNNPLLLIDPSGHDPICNSDGTICSDDPIEKNKSAAAALAEYCATSDISCYGQDIGYIEIDLSYLRSVVGYDPGVVSLPYHINPDYSDPSSLFPWEGMADVAYAEHSAIHPIRYLPTSKEGKYFNNRWLGDATGILLTMVNRSNNNYATPNHAALNNGEFGQYAYPARNPNDLTFVYQEFYGLAFVVSELDVRVEQPYTFFAHQDRNEIRGRSLDGNRNDTCCTETTAFGPTPGRKEFTIPPIYYYSPGSRGAK